MDRKPTYKELEQKIQELEAAKNENNWIESEILNCVSEQIVYHNPDMKIGWVNEPARKALGLPVEEFIGKHCYELWHRKNRICDNCDVAKVFETGKIQKGEINFPDGKILSTRCYPVHDKDQNIVGVAEIAEDITERKRAEQALGRSEEEYRLLFETMVSGFSLLEMIYDENGQPLDCRYVAVNPSHRKHSGLNPSEIIGKTAKEVFNLKDEWIELYGRVDKIGEPVMIEDYAEGLGRWFRIVAYRPKPGFVAVTFDNITDWKEAQEALRDSERRYRGLVENAVMGIYQVTEEGQFLMVNQRMAEMFDYISSKDFMESVDNISKLYKYPEERPGILKEINAKGFIRGKEIAFKKKNGQDIWARINTLVTTNREGQTVYEGVMEDITAWKKLEEQLRQAQKMEAIGTLAGGIAHDFNNILQVIIINTEMALVELSGGTFNPHRLKEVLKSSNRAADLVKQILTFSRQGERKPLPLSLYIIVKEALKMLRSSLPTTIEIRQDIEAKKDMVLADPTQIHQVMMNLGTNAAHAMRQNGGVLEVSLRDEYIDSQAVTQYHDLSPGDHVRLTVRDTGPGMAADVIERIFDPFFTTKAPGEGTGLGLSVVHGIIKNMGGDIRVDSVPEKGTTFVVLFPMAKGEVAPKREVVAPIPKGNERILFVDDEKTTVDAIQSILENLGYTVTAKTSSIEALETFRMQPDKFDLVITDMTMPNMTGVDLTIELMKIRPDIPIILITGFSELIDADRAKAMGIKAFVMKPIIMRKMAEVVRKVLDEK